MIRLKGIRKHYLGPSKPIFLLILLFTLSSVADVDDAANGKGSKDTVLPEGIVKVRGQAPIVAAGSDEKEAKEKRKPSPVSQTRHIILSPMEVDFKDQPVGMPRSHVVQVTNNHSRTVQITSVSGNSLSFHPSLLQTKVVAPGESVSFDVIFLPREEGPTNGMLYIHTSLGTLYYEVKGWGTPNPYRLHPLTGSRIPINGTYAPIISMYNPYSEPLQVTEMYSSGGDLHLELVKGQQEGAGALWEIRPFETKNIMRVNFVGRVARVHSGYIRIKTNHLAEDEVLVLPVLVEVTRIPGVYIQRDHCIDFGIVKRGDPERRMHLSLVNTFGWDMTVAGIRTEPSNPAIAFEITTTTLSGKNQRGARVATVIFKPDRYESLQQQKGKIQVTIKDTDSLRTIVLEAHYRVIALLGSLYPANTSISFRVGKPPFKSVSQNITLQSTFTEPVVIYDAKLPVRADGTELFKVKTVKMPYVIPPGPGNHTPISVEFTPTSSDCMVSTDVRLYSNASIFSIPVYCYDGSLQYKLDSPDELADSLEFGLIGESDIFSRTFRIINNNPVEVVIVEHSLSKDLIDALVSFVGVRPVVTCKDHLQLDKTELCNESDYSAMRRSKSASPSTPSNVRIASHTEAVFEVVVSNVTREGTFIGEVFMRTSYAKELHVPIHYKVVLGSLEVKPAKIFFNTFPYKLSSVTLSAVSRFKQPVVITSVTPETNSAQLSHHFLTESKQPPVLLPGRTAEIGNVLFNATDGPTQPNLHYLGVQQGAAVGEKEWMSQLYQIVGNANVSSSDRRNYQTLRERWKKLMESKERSWKGMLVVETNVSTSHHIAVEAEYSWPSIATVTRLQFAPTLLMETETELLPLANPSDVPVVVQVVSLNYYPHADSVISLLQDRLDLTVESLRFDKLATFSLPEAPVENESSTVLSSLGSEFTVTHLLPPHSTHDVQVTFSPKSDKLYRSLLIVRNNLTVLEAVVLEGRGVTPQLTVEGREPGTDLPILFEYTEKMLSTCESNQDHPSTEGVNVVQFLTLNNTSPAVLVIRSLSIDGYSCEAYGYEISQCRQEVVIAANESKKVEIRHIPDFTMSKITANLHVHVSDNLVLVYPLLTTLPHHMLPACYAAMPRPYWEVWVSKGLFGIMVLMLVLVVLLAWRDAHGMNAKVNGDLVRTRLDNLRCSCQFRDPLSGCQPTHQPNENTLFHNASQEDISEPLLLLRNTPSRDENIRSPENLSARLSPGFCPRHGPVHTTMDRSTHGVARSKRSGPESVADGKQQHSAVASSISSSDSRLRPRPPSLSPHFSQKILSSDGREAEHPDERRKDGEPTAFADARGARGRTGKETLRDSSPAGSKAGVKSGGVPVHFNSSSTAAGETLKPEQFKAGAHRDALGPSSSKSPEGVQSIGDKEKQGRKTKQASGRKQQAKTQPKTQPQQGPTKMANSSKTSAASKTVTDKGDLLQHRESSDSVTSTDSTSSAKPRDGSEKSKEDNDNAAGEGGSEVSKATAMNAPSEDTKNGQAPPLESSVTTPKKEHPPQLSRKERKRKAKAPASPTAESQKIVGKALLQPTEQAEPLDKDFSANSEEGLYEGEQLVGEEPTAFKAMGEAESSVLTGKAGQKEKKGKKADSLDDISPDSPVLLRIGKGNVPKVPAKSKLVSSESSTSASDPFSKSVDKTSYVSKKAGTRRLKTSPDIPQRTSASDLDVDLEKRQPSSEPNSDRDQSPESPPSERVGDFFVRQQLEGHDATGEQAEESEVEENVASTYIGEEERDEESKTAELLEVKQAILSSASLRATSPHELAASILRQQSKKTDAGTEEPTSNAASNQPKKRATAVREDKPKTSPKLDNEEQMFYTAPSPVKGSKGHPYSARLLSRPSKATGKVAQQGMETQEATLTFPQVAQPPPSGITPDATISTTYVATVQEPAQVAFTASTAPTPSTPGRYQYSKPANTLGDYMPQGVMNAGRNPVRPSAEVMQDTTAKYSHFTGTAGATAASSKLRKVPVAAIQQDPSLHPPGYYPTSGGVPVSDQHGRVTVELPTSTNSGGYAPSSQPIAGNITPHMYASSMAASRKRPSHLELPSNITPHQMITLATLQARAEGYASLQDKIQQQQQQRSNSASLQYAYNQMRAQPQAVRYQTQLEYHPVGQTARQSATTSPFGLLNTLTTPHMMYNKVPPMEKQPPPPLQPHMHTADLGGEYLPISSKLATPTASAHPPINLAPGASSSKMDAGNVGRRDMGWQGEKPSLHGLWEPGVPQAGVEDAQSYNMFGTSSIWGPLQESGAAVPWMTTLKTPGSSPSLGEGRDKKGKFPEGSPFE